MSYAKRSVDLIRNSRRFLFNNTHFDPEHLFNGNQKKNVYGVLQPELLDIY